MNHKYLKDAGFDKYLYVDDLPKDDERRVEWAKQRKEYGMDERITWSLNTESLLWLYEHIKMYLDFSDIDHVDLDFHKFTIQGEEFNQKQILEKIVETIEMYFNVKDCFYNKYGNDVGLYETTKPLLSKEIWDLWSTVFPAMWW